MKILLKNKKSKRYKAKKYKGTRRDGFLARRARMFGGLMVPLFLWGRKIAVVIAIIVFIAWVGSWIWLSGAPQNAFAWSKNFVIEKSAAAGFRTQNILVEGRVYSDAEILLALIDIEKGDPLLTFNPRKAADLIGRMSWVREVNVQRQWPDSIYVGLTERVPIALWKSKKKVYVIDERGAVITDFKLERFGDLLLIDGGQDAALKSVNLIQNLQVEMLVYERAEQAKWVGSRRWDVTLKSGVTVKLPEEDVSLALHRLSTAQEESNLLDKDLISIDLRDPMRMIIRTRPGAVHEYKSDLSSASDEGSDI